MYNFNIGDIVRIKDNSEYYDQAHYKGGTGIGEIININHYYSPEDVNEYSLRIRWNKSNNENEYRPIDVDLLSDFEKLKKRKKVKNPEVDPFEEEHWGYIEESIDNEFNAGDIVKIRDDSPHKNQAYSNGGDGVGRIVTSGIERNGGYVLIVNWNNGISNFYRLSDVIHLKSYKKRKKLKNPEVDPFDEEEWGFVQESYFHDFKVGDKVRMRDSSSYKYQAYDMSHYGYRSDGDGTGEVVLLKTNGLPLRVLWKNRHENTYNYEDVELISRNNRKRLEKPEIDPFGEENWGFVQESILTRDDYEVGDRVRMIKGSRYEYQAYGDDRGDNGLGTITNIIYNRNETLPFAINWDNGHRNSYGEMDIEPLVPRTPNKKRKKLKNPEVDPFDEEKWGFVQENVKNEFQVGDIVKIRDDSTYRVQAYHNGGDGVGEIINPHVRGNEDHSLKIVWHNGDINYYRVKDVIYLKSYEEKKKIKKLEIDPFEEETWYEIQENSNFNDLRIFYIPFKTVTEMVDIAKFLNNLGEDVTKYDKVIQGIGFDNPGHKVYRYNKNSKNWTRTTAQESIMSIPPKILLTYENLLKIENKNKIKKPEIDPFGEENWGYVED